MSRSLLSKTATSLRRCSAVARHLSEKDETVIGHIVSAQQEELEQEIANLEVEAEKVGDEDGVMRVGGGGCGGMRGRNRRNVQPTGLGLESGRRLFPGNRVRPMSMNNSRG